MIGMILHLSVKQRSRLALLLMVPPTSIGALMTTSIAPGAVGQTIALLSGIWMLVLPSLWCRWGDRTLGTIVKPLPFNRPDRSTWMAGMALGLVMFGLILGSYWGVGRYWLDVADIRSRIQAMGMNVPLMVFGFGTFQTLVNSYIEEYVWRWFVDHHCQVLWPQRFAIVISAGFFTIHHVILMVAYCDNLWLVLVGTVAVFTAGVLWAICRQTYRSLWPSYLSHLAADLALQIASWHILLG
jgi:uncharacterized protein